LRFKTGTCARLDGSSIDFSKLKMQLGDKLPQAFSFSNKLVTTKQLPCYISYSDDATHEIIRRNLHSSPLFSGKCSFRSGMSCANYYRVE